MLKQLWKHRSRPPLGSMAWLKAWAKRLLLVPVLVRQIIQHGVLRHAGAQVDPSAFFSDASLITGNRSRLSVGEKSFVGRVEVSLHAPVSLGRRVCINDGAKLLTGSHDVGDPTWPTVTAPIVVEDYCWIATNAIILPGVRLGCGAVVGAGAVVSRDVPPHAVATGNPARILERRRPEHLDYDPTAGLALMNAWWGSMPIREPEAPPV